MKYESVDDVKLRLHRSVVGYKGHPVHVDEVAGINDVIVTNLVSGGSERAKVSDLDLDPSHLPLGYVMADDRVFLTSRKPCRKYKQGLTNENFHAKEVLQEREREGRLNLSVTSRYVAKTMMGEFPDIGTAFQLVRTGQKRIVPFNREWAVADTEGDICVVYRGEVVGYAGNTSVLLLPERAYLKESFELCIK